VFCPSGLTVPDMKALVGAATLPSDSPIKKKKDDLRQQLFGEPQYSRVQELANDLCRNTSTAAAKALVTLALPTTASTPV
jgi:hypothetical protein